MGPEILGISSKLTISTRRGSLIALVFDSRKYFRIDGRGRNAADEKPDQAEVQEHADERVPLGDASGARFFVGLPGRRHGLLGGGVEDRPIDDSFGFRKRIVKLGGCLCEPASGPDAGVEAFLGDLESRFSFIDGRRGRRIGPKQDEVGLVFDFADRAFGDGVVTRRVREISEHDDAACLEHVAEFFGRVGHAVVDGEDERPCAAARASKAAMAD